MKSLNSALCNGALYVCSFIRSKITTVPPINSELVPTTRYTVRQCKLYAVRGPVRRYARTRTPHTSQRLGWRLGWRLATVVGG